MGIWLVASSTVVFSVNNQHLASRRCTELLVLLHPRRDGRNHHISNLHILRIPTKAAASTKQGFQKQQEAIGNDS